MELRSQAQLILNFIYTGIGKPFRGGNQALIYRNPNENVQNIYFLFDGDRWSLNYLKGIKRGNATDGGKVKVDGYCLDPEQIDPITRSG